MNPNSLLDKLGNAVSGLGFWPKVTKFLPIGVILAQYDGGKLFREVVATLMKLKFALVWPSAHWSSSRKF